MLARRLLATILGAAVVAPRKILTALQNAAKTQRESQDILAWCQQALREGEGGATYQRLGSLYSSAPIPQKLLALQLHRAGLIDAWTLAEELDAQKPFWSGWRKRYRILNERGVFEEDY